MESARPLGAPATGAQDRTSVAIVESDANLMLQYFAAAWPGLVPQFGAPQGFSQTGGIHALPHYIDELEQDFGTDMYYRMLCDAQVKAADSVLRDAILDKPLQVTQCEDQYTKDNEQQAALAKAVAEFVAANFKELDDGFHLLSWDMLEGISLGYKLAEMVFELREVVPGNGPQTVLKDIVPKPHEAITIMVDQYNGEIGYLPQSAGPGFWQGIPAGALPSAKPVLGEDGTETEYVEIPDLVLPEKVVRFTWQPRNADPRGTSNLRSAYVPWRLKIGLYPAYEAYLARFAQPSTALELGGGDPPPMMDANGVMITNPAQKIAALLTNLRQFQSGGAMVVPTGRMNMLQASGEGEVYLRAFELCDEQITKSILLQNLTTESAKYGTKAQAQVHQDTMGLLIAMGKQAYLACIRERIVKVLVRINYGEAGLRVLPNLSFGETEQQDLLEAGQMYAALMGGGMPETRMVFPLHYNGIYEKLHMDALPEELITKLQALIEEQITAAVQTAQDPQGLKAQAEQQRLQGEQGERDAQDQERAQAEEAESYY